MKVRCRPDIVFYLYALSLLLLASDFTVFTTLSPLFFFTGFFANKFISFSAAVTDDGLADLLAFFCTSFFGGGGGAAEMEVTDDEADDDDVCLPNPVPPRVFCPQCSLGSEEDVEETEEPPIIG